jgi:cation transport ATPase
MKCKYCKTDIDDGVLVCPNCGAPAPVDKDYQEDWDQMMGYEREEDEDFTTSNQTYNQANYTAQFRDDNQIEDAKLKAYQEEKQKKNKAQNMSKLSIWAFICSVMTVLAPIGFILGIIDLFRKDGKSKIMSVIAIGVAIFDVLYIGFFAYMLEWF